MDEARAAEAAIRTGDGRGPLHGIPIGIKDMIDVAGLPTTAQAVHLKDAMPVARCRGRRARCAMQARSSSASRP